MVHVTDAVFVMPGTVSPPRGGLLRDLYDRYEAVREALSRIDKAAREMGMPEISSRLVESNTTSDQRGPEVRYLEIFAVSIATHHMLVTEGVQPVAIVGQSIGELWALAAAENLSVEDAARLAVARSQALTRQNWNGKMLAVGVDGHRAESLAGLFSHPHLVLACENAPRQSVISGPESLIQQVERVADTLNWPSVRLEVPHPTHTPAMAPAARDLRATGPRVPYGAGRWRVCSPWLGRDIGDDDPVELVANALTARVQMLHTLRALHAAGADTFVECGEWPVVTRLIEGSIPNVQCIVPLSESDPVQVVRALVATDSGPLSSSAPSSNGHIPTVTARADTLTPGVAVPATPAAPMPDPTPEPPAIPPVTAPATTPVTIARDAPSTSSGLDYETVLAELQTLYGDFLGYPPDLLGEDDGLESELGVESLKQVALLRRVSEQFNRPDLRADSSLLTGGTLRQITEAVIRTPAEATK